MTTVLLVAHALANVLLKRYKKGTYIRLMLTLVLIVARALMYAQLKQ